MINKQSLWFLTLFSLILVLSVYYVTMPNDLLISNNNSHTSNEKEIEQAGVTIEESELLTALRVDLEEQRALKKAELQSLLTNKDTKSEDKNEAFETLKYLNLLTSEEENLELKLKNELNLDSFIKIENNQISVVIVKDNHDIELANKVMRLIQDNYKEKKHISVKFEKK